MENHFFLVGEVGGRYWVELGKGNGGQEYGINLGVKY